MVYAPTSKLVAIHWADFVQAIQFTLYNVYCTMYIAQYTVNFTLNCILYCTVCTAVWHTLTTLSLTVTSYCYNPCLQVKNVPALGNVIHQRVYHKMLFRECFNDLNWTFLSKCSRSFYLETERENVWGFMVSWCC